MKFSIRRFISVLLAAMMLLMQFGVVAADVGYDGEIEWEFNPDTRELRICGEGEMSEFLSNNYPWRDYNAEILTIEGDFTSIGMGAFENFYSLRIVQIDAPVETIQSNAFANCDHLEFVFLPRELRYVECDVFSHHLNSGEILFCYLGSSREWRNVSVHDECMMNAIVYLQSELNVYFEYDAEYNYGEEIRAHVIVEKDDGMHYPIDICSVYGYDKYYTGDQNVILRFGPFHESADVYVKDGEKPDVPVEEYEVQISVRTEYNIGEEFYAEVYVYTYDGNCYQVEDFIVEGFDSWCPGDQEVTVRYNDYCEIFMITVLEPEPEQKYEIVFENVKTEYELGEEFYIEIYECLDDERWPVPLEECVIEGFDSWSVGEQTVTVCYGDYMETFAVVVYDEPVVEEGITWTFDETVGELAIFGKGEMTESEDGIIPWKEHKYKITNVIIADGITSICRNAFESCIQMQSIYIPASVTKIGDNAFIGCSKLTAVYYGGSYSDWKMIETGAGNTRLTAVKITYNSTGERNIVMECTQHDYLVGDRYFNINVYEEDSNGILVPVMEDKYTISGFDTTTAGTRTVTVSYGGYSETFEITVSNRDNLTWNYNASTRELVIDGYGDMGEYDSWFEYGNGYNTAPWYSCLAQVKTITIGDNVTSISKSAFLCAKNLTTINFGAGIKEIGVYAFQYCSALKEVTIPDTITVLNGAFWNCTGLETVNFGGNIVELKGAAFYNCKLKKVVLPETVETIGYASFESCAELTEIYIPESVTSIGNFTFYGCTALSDVYYGGTEEEWNAISVGTDNECLYNATIHYMGEDESEDPVEPEPEPTYEIRIENVKTEYEYGEEFYAEVYVYCDDGTYYQVEDYKVEGFDSYAPGEQTVTVAYNDYSETFKVTVNEAVVEPEPVYELVIENAKTEYEYGEEFYAEVYVYGDDGSRYQVEDYKVDGFDSYAPGEQTVTIIFENYVATVDVYVNEPVEPEPTYEIRIENVKTEYEYGEEFYAEVYVYGDDGTYYQAENYEVDGFDSYAPGEQTVTVTYNDYSETFKVTVNEQVIVEPDPKPENAPTVSVSTEKCMAGNTVDVVVSISNNTGFANLGLEIKYDTALTLVNVSANSNIGATFTSAQSPDVYPYNIGFDAINGTDYNGELVTLTFEVPEGTEAGDYYVNVDFYKGRYGNYTDGYDVNYDVNENPLGLCYENGSVTVYNYIPGDINGDGTINNKDGTCLLKYLAGWDLDNVVEEALDTDGNGFVNAKDGTRLLRYLAGWDVTIN